MTKNDEGRTIGVYIDMRPNLPKEQLKMILQEQFERRLDASVDRLGSLPTIVVRPADDDHPRLVGYLSLLEEARELFIAGYFYACVAMCGIVGERLVKDMFRESMLVWQGGHVDNPPSAALNQLERVESSSLRRFLKEAGLLSDEAAKAADKLTDLRNKYAHARGENTQADAAKAVGLLDTLIEGTVSVFKDFTIKDGALVPRER